MSLDDGTNALKGNATALKNDTKINSLQCTRINQEVKAVHFIDALKIKVNLNYTGRFITFYVITNIYNKKTKGPNLLELFTATGKLKRFFFDN
jgi:hypothetical protein